MEFVKQIIDIFSCLWNCFEVPVSSINELEENLNKLRNLMDELKDKTNDVRSRVVEFEERKQMKRTNQVDGWLRRVDAMETDVEEILREGSREIQERRLGGYCPKNCISSYKLVKRVERKVTALEELKSNGNFDVEAETLPPVPVEVRPVVSTTGMDLMFDKAWRFISDEQVGILGIYGMGGVGKTTLLKRINNEFLHREGRTRDFDAVIWVVVSKEANTMKIQDDIAKRLKVLSLLEDNRSVDDRAAKLYSALSKKKFALLLDDIWDRIDLEAIGIPHPDINNKAKIIFTTRSEDVCGLMEAHKKMRVECLDWPEAWKLFQGKVGEDALNSHVEIPALAVKVAKECAGLPLALITIGRAMASKKTPQDWRHAETILNKSASEFPTSKFSGMGKEVYSKLKFSYDTLPNDTIRSCFLYCSLYPEDHSIGIKKLIHYWLGEGFLDVFEDMEQAQDKGYHIVGILKDACLLEICDGDEEEVKMHDVIRDMALWIGCECGEKKDKFLVRAGVSLSESPEVGKWIEAERISLMFNEIETLGGDDEEIPSSCPNLVTLILSQNRKLTKLSDGFFKHMKVLRFLDISKTNIKEFPMSIVELVELQYLNLSKTKISKLPREIINLVKLKYLILRDIKNLLINSTISRFSKLQILDLTMTSYEYVDLDNESDGAFIKELECLKDLKFLSIFLTNALSLERFFSSDKFKRCTTELYIKYIQGLRSFGISTPRILKSLIKLDCVGCSDLEDMAINWTVGKEGNCLPKLRYVDICFCKALKGLSWLRGAPNLEVLQLEDCESLKEICDGVKDGCFPNLYIVQIWRCTALKDLSWLRGAPNLQYLKVFDCKVLEIICDGVNDGCFPNLHKVNISKCNALKDLSWLRGAPNLQILLVLDCKGLEVIFDDVKDECFQKFHSMLIQSCAALKDLPCLRGAPNIEHLQVEDCESLEQVICDGVKDGCFPNLHKVNIDRCAALKDLSWLFGAPNIERLEVHNCERLEVICDGVHAGCFPNLHKVNIGRCDALKDLSWLRGAPNLEELKLWNCKCLEVIGDGQDVEVKENPTTFSCLKSLDLQNLPELKSICWLSFPSDIKVIVENCPKAPPRMRSP